MPNVLTTDTQQVRNVDFANAGTPGIIGSGGAFPTYLTAFQSTSSFAGLTCENLGAITIGGITFLKIRLSGTTTAAAALYFNFDETNSGNGNILGSIGGNFVATAQIGVLAGDPTPFSKVGFGIIERMNFGNYVAGASNTTSISRPTLSTRRVVGVTSKRTLTGATTTKITPSMVLEATSGTAIDCTFLIGLVNAYSGVIAHSPTPITGAIPTESLDGTIKSPLPAGALIVDGWSSASGEDGYAAALSDAGGTNRVSVRRQGGLAYARVTISGSIVFDQPLGDWPASTAGRAVVAWTPAGIRASFNGGPVASASNLSLSSLSGMASWRAGADHTGANIWGGSITQLSVKQSGSDPRDASALDAQFMFDDFNRTDGALGTTPDGRFAWTSIPENGPSSAVRTATIVGGKMSAPSAAFQSTTTVTAAYPGIDLGAGRRMRRIVASFVLKPAISFTGAITNNTLTIASVDAAPVGTLAVGSVLNNGRTVTALGTGTGGTGTYTVSAGPDIASTRLTAYNPNWGNLTLISQRNGITAVDDVTGTNRPYGSLHVTFTESVLQFSRFAAGGVLTVVQQINYPAPLRTDGTVYTCSITRIGDGFFDVLLPDGSRAVIYSPEAEAQMGRYVIAEPYFRADGVQPDFVAIEVESERDA